MSKGGGKAVEIKSKTQDNVIEVHKKKRAKVDVNTSNDYSAAHLVCMHDEATLRLAVAMSGDWARYLIDATLENEKNLKGVG